MTRSINVDEAVGSDAIPSEIADVVVSSRSYADDTLIYPALAWLRDNQPLGKAFVDGYDPIWIVSKHADVMAISRDNKTFINGDQNLILQTRESDAFVRKTNKGKVRSMNSLAYMDQPEHGRYRGITSNWFMQGNVRRLEERMRSIARDSVAQFLALGGECDFVKDFVLYYPLRVIMDMLGVPPSDEPAMLKLTQQLFGGDDPEERRADIPEGPDAAARAWRATLEDFYAYFRELSRDRRAKPRDDLISLIANTKIEGEFIDEDRELDYYVAIATAGHDTTSAASAGGMLGLLRFPDQFGLLKSDPALIPGFIDESIRWSTPIKHFMRCAARDVEIRGRLIRENDRLFLSYPSANRDCDAFDEPDVFRITRGSSPHLAFGSGPHMCIGQHLAKLDMRILFEELLPVLDHVELSGEPRLLQSNFISGLKSLPIRYRAK
ncbi:cytochrome P450 [Burkholderia pseudomultivorans]|uniref:Cytochrome n=1 Tax=Burkholderia pseudomultivorans TaxID=1207504 RepID=A0A132EIX1_9BURK|nr:cytochrome P450 [Burkholderia pseudomultivorans]KWF30987.1 cytochrome [Burkholderia pseudomultivorans]